MRSVGTDLPHQGVELRRVFRLDRSQSRSPEDPAQGSRKIPFSRVLYIERDDFMEVTLFPYTTLFRSRKSVV